MLSLASSFEVPRRLRVIVRARETSLAILAATAGAVAGVVVAAMGTAVDVLHTLLFGLPPGQRLSAAPMLDPLHAIGIPVIGGALFGVVLLLLVRWRPDREIDPIEANALHGGRMSLRGSFIVALQTLWSSGVGASVGLEAGYTQLASGIAAWLGRRFRLRRNDQRLMVGAGAAGAIAGAFHAPLAGAFYAFELIIGGYSAASLAPVGLAALMGYLVSHAFAPNPLGIIAGGFGVVTSRDLAIAGLLGILAGLAGIVLMRGVALCERFFTLTAMPAPLRLGIGGLAVGLLALVTPQVMSSGHGALLLSGVLNRPLTIVALVFCLKAVASMISLGAGFRGGLFFASLLLGVLGGRLFAAALSVVLPGLQLDPNVYAVIGMGALSVSVIGAPLTMTFVALETTGDFWLTTAVLIAVIISAQLTREIFGYSFATWRFHLRGETIRSAADVGWIRDLTVGSMMRPDVSTIPAETPINEFRHRFPLGSTGQVVAVDKDHRYAGIVIVPEAHGLEEPTDEPVSTILHYPDTVLLPPMNVREAAAAFDRAEAESLAVVDSLQMRRVLGLLTESHTLRRYAEESEQRRRELMGER